MKAWKHFKFITIHKWYVFKNCYRAGIPLQGIVHDLSKYSPTEFFESVKYFDGTKSPIVKCKEDKEYSMAWYHHRGRNKHHWEFWVDNFDHGMTAPIIPYKYAVEYICDILAAGKAYEKDQWSFKSTYKWWKNKMKTMIIHPATARFIDTTLAMLAITNSYGYLAKWTTDRLYTKILMAYQCGRLDAICPLYPEDLSEIENEIW